MNVVDNKFIGAKVGDFALEEQIASGPFSWVYRGRHVETRQEIAFKIARAEMLPEGQQPVFAGATEAQCVDKDGLIHVRPCLEDLIRRQKTILAGCAHPTFVQTGKLFETFGLWGYPMEYLGRTTLRDVLPAGLATTIDVFIDLADSLLQLSLRHAFEYHGDLKPENIMVTKQGVRLIDPGYFGLLNCEEGEALNCAITTPAYYPLREPNDLLALGIIFWEAACMRHPLAPIDSLTFTSASSTIGRSVCNWISSLSYPEQHYLAPILCLQRPTVIKPNITSLLEEILLKGLQLQISSTGLIEKGPGFQDFAQWKQALIALKSASCETLLS